MFDQEQESSTREKLLLFGWWPWAVASVLVLLLGLFWLFNSAASSPPVVAPTDPPAVAAEETEAEPAFVPPTATPVPVTDTPLPVEPTEAAVSIETPTPEPTFTLTATSMPTLTPTPEPTLTPTPEPTATVTPTPSPAPTATPTELVTRQQLRGKILFRTDRFGGAVELYRMDADGSNQLPLEREAWSLYTQLQAELPYSQDQRKQIVVRGEGQLDLWRADLDTHEELRITSTGQPEYDPAWSPVDDQIAYVSEETGNGDIYVLNLGGSAVTRLTDNVDDFDKHPTWSPDGTRIAFWSDMGFNDRRQIWVIDLGTGVLTSLSDNPFNDWDPVWVH